jgi:hypothetical protein
MPDEGSCNGPVVVIGLGRTGLSSAMRARMWDERGAFDDGPGRGRFDGAFVFALEMTSSPDCDKARATSLRLRGTLFLGVQQWHSPPILQVHPPSPTTRSARCRGKVALMMMQAYRCGQSPKTLLVAVVRQALPSPGANHGETRRSLALCYHLSFCPGPLVPLGEHLLLSIHRDI